MLNIQNLRKEYPGFSLSIDQFHLEPNFITGIVGLNGAGKSTFFKTICGLIPDHSGTIELFGLSSPELLPTQKEKLGVLFNDATFSRRLNIAQCKKVLKVAYPSFDEALFDQMCQQFNLPYDKSLANFSTGMEVRFKLAVALTHDAKLLILDEPTAGLDIVARNNTYECLQDFMEKPDRSILISSHIASDLESLCDDFWVIHNGQLILHETVDALKNEYGILSVDAKTLDTLDPVAIVGIDRQPHGIKVLVSDRQFYEENYPGIVVSAGNIDDLLTILEQGE
ncbi:ABC transporter, ATP-binding protein, partial [gut metagenome]